MPADHARKGPVRRRQAATGESYTEAAKALRRSYNRPVWDPWVAPRCEEADPIPGHDPWFSGPCPEGCPTRECPDYIAYLATLPMRERLPRPRPEREPYVCPGPPSCTDDCCACNYVHLTMCRVCEAVYSPGLELPCPNCGRRPE
ncbi:hypothetical protein [Streptomyces sp. NRRL B-24572]|uniref:hypothetical protein n=1 Tax=Streptomyces sp. NRRL B-24572 TaxID=1962156 RepID=UPI00117FB500|nr:hypothetical protein [Streptomyces sp. NRRL B-24572]